MLTIQDSTVYFGSASPESGSGAHKETALLSITTAPAAPFAKGSKYFRNEDDVEPELNKKIYTAVVDGTWDGAKISEPVFGAYYTYNGDTYTWDGDSLQIFELEDYQLISEKTDSYTSQSSTTYPSSQALYDGLSFKEDLSNKAQNFEDTTSTTKYPTVKAVADYVVKESIIRNFDDAGITKTTSSYTFPELADEIRKKQFTTGTTLYGEVRNQGMPTGIGNAEIRVEILETKNIVNPSGSTYKSQVLEFTLFSTDIEPKEWTFIYYDQRNTQWVWAPKDHIVIVDDITMFQIPNAPLGSELPLPVLDDITIPGEYTIRFDLSDMEPGALLIGNLIVSNAGLLSQKYTCEISGATFILTRQQESNTWTPWFCISGLNNFFTPANLVAGTNLQITHAADESGYDKYTVGTTDKVWTQDNLKQGNNVVISKEENQYYVGDDAVACWHFDDNLDNIISSGPTLTYEQTPTYTDNSDEHAFNTGKSLVLNQNYTLNQPINLYLNWTIDFWCTFHKGWGFFLNGYSQSDAGSSITYYPFRLGIDTNSASVVSGYQAGTAGSRYVFTLDTTQHNDGKMHHIALCMSNQGILYYYFDGTLVSTNDFLNAPNRMSVYSGFQLRLLESCSSNTIDELRISNTCRWTTPTFDIPTKPYSASKYYDYYTINAPIMTGATSLANGVAGVVPAPAIADKDKYLKGDGTWSTTVPTLTWYTNNTTASITIVDTSTARLVKVYRNGLLLQENEDYTINGTTLTLIGGVLEAVDKIAVEVFN